MRDTGNRELRKLAHDYYRGEMSYASYRRARTQLLDRITAVTGDVDRTRSMMRQAHKPGVAGQSTGLKPERSWLQRGTLWLLIVALATVMLIIVLAIKSEAITRPLGQADPAGTTISGAVAEWTGINSTEDDWYPNG